MCNYRGTQRVGFYESTFAIYRLRASDDAIVPTLTARRAFGTGLGEFLGVFGCTNLTLDNDILQNDVVGDIDDSDRYLMTTGTSYNGCGDAAVPQNVNSLSTRYSRILHIHADIGKLGVATFYNV